MALISNVPVSNGSGGPQPEGEEWRSASLIELLGSVHRLILVRDDAVLMTDVDNHNPWLVDEHGRLRLPSAARVTDMVERGEARPVEPEAIRDPSPTARLKQEIRILDDADIPQGDKSIWIFLSRAWTTDLVERFGPFDDPWRIRRWRADLRKAAK